VGSSWSPGVPFSVDDGETGIGNVEATVFVDGGYVGGRGDVKCVFADEGFVGDVVGAGNEWELICGDAGAGLEEAPLCAILIIGELEESGRQKSVYLIWPRSPVLSDVVLFVVCDIVFSKT
jgi:hypothetical protein